MRVKARFFASLVDLIGAREMDYVLPENSTLLELRNLVKSAHPQIDFSRFIYAVNAHYASATKALRDGDVVAFLPPVSGG